jgi:DNA-binding NarL/FixJ family response regulator
MGLSVVLGEDHYLVREGITRLLARQTGVAVVGRARTRDELMDAIDAHRPDVVVTDIRMPPELSDEGLQVAAWVRQRHPATGVVVLSQYLEPEYALALFEAGSEGRAYLVKDRVHDGAELARAVETVHAGGSVVDPQVIHAMLDAHERKRASVLDGLTPREQEVLSQLAQGKSNAAIAHALVLTKRAVEKHVNAIFWKLGLKDSEDVSRRVMATLMLLSASDRET